MKTIINNYMIKHHTNAYMNIRSPRNVIVPAIFPVPTSLNGIRMMNNGNVLKIHAHAGRDVPPVTTVINNVTMNTSNAT